MKRLLIATAALISVAILFACSGGGGGGGGVPPVTSVKLAQTGQTTCYDPSGNVIACTGTGQDGDLRNGVAWPSPRFAVSSSGTGTVVTDNLTSLIWQQDGSMPTVGLCTGGTTTWQGALNYVACLNTNNYLGHNDWRLPNINELQSLVHYGQSNPAGWLDSQGFSNTQSTYYWSSTSFSADTTSAMSVYFYINGYTSSVVKTSLAFVRCVRGQTGSFGNSSISLPQTGQTMRYAAGDDGETRSGVAWPGTRFSVASSGTDTVVTDNLTGLMWQQDNSSTAGLCTSGTATTWQGALNYVACLNTNNYLGHNDWRLPNEVELQSLVNYGQPSPATWLDSQGFTNTQMLIYWSSTTYTPGAGNAWGVLFFNGIATPGGKSGGGFVRCVRGGQ